MIEADPRDKPTNLDKDTNSGSVYFPFFGPTADRSNVYLRRRFRAPHLLKAEIAGSTFVSSAV